MLEPLASVADLAAFTGRDIPAGDAAANLYLDIASGMVRDYLNSQVLEVLNDVTILEPAGDGSYLLLPEMPVTRVTQVETWDGTGWTVRDPASYVVSFMTGVITPLKTYGVTRWPSASPWRVTYSHGYDEVPQSIRGAVLGVAARAYTSPVGVIQERVGSYQVRYDVQAAGFNPIEQLALARYVYPRIA